MRLDLKIQLEDIQREMVSLRDMPDSERAMAEANKLLLSTIGVLSLDDYLNDHLSIGIQETLEDIERAYRALKRFHPVSV